MYHARGVVTAEKISTGEQKEEMKALKEGVRPEWIENWYDGLTYCELRKTGESGPSFIMLSNTLQAHGTLLVSSSQKKMS